MEESTVVFDGEGRKTVTTKTTTVTPVSGKNFFLFANILVNPVAQPVDQKHACVCVALITFLLRFQAKKVLHASLVRKLI